MSKVEKVVKWIQDYFEENGKGCKAVIGISGGTDSSVCAALLVRALGEDRVLGVMMPEGYQHDIDVSREVIDFLNISSMTINIGETCNELRKEISEQFDYDVYTKDVFRSNTPARIRMAALYGISGLVNGRVANTCNLSEDWVGYSTKCGDSAGDFSPISHFTKTEVRELGRELGLPQKFIEKIPEDGMSGKSDEEKLGFTYEVLDHYIRTGEIDDENLKEKIDRMHKANLHKISLMPAYMNED